MLHAATKRVARYAARGADAPEQYRAVRWIPAQRVPYLQQTEGSWVVAYDGTHGIAVHVEEALPDVLLPVDGLAQSVASAVARVICRPQSIGIESITGGTFQIPLLDVGGFPYPPNVNNWRIWEMWPDVVRLVHCAATGKIAQPAFAHLCLKPTGIEVTDTVCIGIAQGHGWDHQVLVPAKLVESRDKAEQVRLSIDEHLAVLCLDGTEYRWGVARRDMPYPDLSSLAAQKSYYGVQIEFNPKALIDALRQAISISTSNAVALTFERERLGLLGWRGEGGAAEHKYDAVIPFIDGVPHTEPVTVYCDGKLLLRAVRAVDTAIVAVSYSSPTEPLRLAWGNCTELLWPWLL